MLVKLPIVWLSSYSFGEVVFFSKNSIFPDEEAMSPNMPSQTKFNSRNIEILELQLLR